MEESNPGLLKALELIVFGHRVTPHLARQPTLTRLPCPNVAATATFLA